MNRRKFITGCACYGSLALFSLIYKTGLISNKNINGPYIFDGVQIDLVQHCNLNCKYCNHFSCIAEPEFYNIETFEKDLAQISKLCNKQLKGLALAGGEPLLHPNLKEILYISRKYFPISQILLITNGILLDKMSDLFWIALSKNNIYLYPTIYPIENINWEKIYNKAVKYNCNIGSFHGNHIYKSPDEIAKHKVQEFYKTILNFNKEQDNTNFCKYKQICTSLYNGKLYPCCIAANIRHFNKKFNKNIPVTEKDYIDIYKVKSSKEINDFLNSNIPFCKYCCGTNKMPIVKWKISSEHDISEWT